MTTREQLKNADTEDMIAELKERDELPESDIDDFDEVQILEALGYTPDEDIDFDRFHQMFSVGQADLAVAEFKRLIEHKTGRIIV